MSYEHWPYLGVFLVLLAAGLGSPVPEDVPLLTGGYLCFAGLARFYLMIPVALAGVLIGDVCLFTVGRVFGHRVVEHRLAKRLVNPSRLVLAERLFARHGVKIIFAGRFLPGLRPMIFMAAGVLKVPFSTFITVNGTAACLSVPLLVGLGMLFGNELQAIKGSVRSVTHIVVIAVATVLLVAGGVYLHQRRKQLTIKAQRESGIDAAALREIRIPNLSHGNNSEGGGTPGSGEEAA